MAYNGRVPSLTTSETELTTAATDALLGALCLFLAGWLSAMPVSASWKRGVWVAALLCMAVGACLGAVAHGVELRSSTRDAIWKPLYLSLGLAVALVAVGASFDGFGETVARRLLPAALISAVVFFVATQLFGGAFVLFILYEAVAIVSALAVYATLAMRDRMPGALVVTAGLVVSLVAAALQATSLSARVIVRFDHNGLFHIVQMVAVALMALGVRLSLR